MAEVEHQVVVPTKTGKLAHMLNARPIDWAEAASYCNWLRSTKSIRNCVAAIEGKSPGEEECKRIGFTPPESTILHMLAHTKPGNGLGAVAWGHYQCVWEFVCHCCHSSPWIDVTNGKQKTALHMAAAAGNSLAMESLFQCRAGHYRELWLFFQSFVLFYCL